MFDFAVPAAIIVMVALAGVDGNDADADDAGGDDGDDDDVLLVQMLEYGQIRSYV